MVRRPHSTQFQIFAWKRRKIPKSLLATWFYDSVSIISTFWEYTIISYFFSWNLYFLSQLQINDLSYLHKNKEWTDGCLTKYCVLNVDIIHHYVWPFIDASKTTQTQKKNIAPEYNIGVVINELNQINI